jgi:5-enolpyruvylshikimate-3-phosphate synthase
MTAPLAPQDTVITIKGELVSKPYIDITLHLMKTFGVEVENQSYQRFVVRGRSSTSLRATTWLKAMRHRRLTSWRPARLKAVR